MTSRVNHPLTPHRIPGIPSTYQDSNAENVPYHSYLLPEGPNGYVCAQYLASGEPSSCSARLYTRQIEVLQDNINQLQLLDASRSDVIVEQKIEIAVLKSELEYAKRDKEAVVSSVGVLIESITRGACVTPSAQILAESSGAQFSGSNNQIAALEQEVERYRRSDEALRSKIRDLERGIEARDYATESDDDVSFETEPGARCMDDRCACVTPHGPIHTLDKGKGKMVAGRRSAIPPQSQQEYHPRQSRAFGPIRPTPKLVLKSDLPTIPNAPVARPEINPANRDIGMCSLDYILANEGYLPPSIPTTIETGFPATITPRSSSQFSTAQDFEMTEDENIDSYEKKPSEFLLEMIGGFLPPIKGCLAYEPSASQVFGMTESERQIEEQAAHHEINPSAILLEVVDGSLPPIERHSSSQPSKAQVFGVKEYKKVVADEKKPSAILLEMIDGFPLPISPRSHFRLSAQGFGIKEDERHIDKQVNGYKKSMAKFLDGPKPGILKTGFSIEGCYCGGDYRETDSPQLSPRDRSDFSPNGNRNSNYYSGNSRHVELNFERSPEDESFNQGLWDDAEDRNGAVNAHMRASNYKGDTRFPDLFRYGIQYIPDETDSNFLRTVVISNLPLGTTVLDVLSRVRGGEVLSATVVRLGKILPNSSPVLARVVFKDEAAAERYVSYASSHPIAFDDFTVAQVTLVNTPTYPISSKTQACIRQRTRCIGILDLPHHFSLNLLEHILACGNKYRAQGLVEMYVDEMYTLHLEFSSVELASSAWNIIKFRRQYRNLQCRFEDDPCAGETSELAEEVKPRPKVFPANWNDCRSETQSEVEAENESSEDICGPPRKRLAVLAPQKLIIPEFTTTKLKAASWADEVNDELYEEGGEKRVTVILGDLPTGAYNGESSGSNYANVNTGGRSQSAPINNSSSSFVAASGASGPAGNEPIAQTEEVAKPRKARAQLFKWFQPTIFTGKKRAYSNVSSEEKFDEHTLRIVAERLRGPLVPAPTLRTTTQGLRGASASAPARDAQLSGEGGTKFKVDNPDEIDLDDDYDSDEAMTREYYAARSSSSPKGKGKARGSI